MALPLQTSHKGVCLCRFPGVLHGGECVCSQWRLPKILRTPTEETQATWGTIPHVFLSTVLTSERFLIAVIFIPLRKHRGRPIVCRTEECFSVWKSSRFSDDVWHQRCPTYDCMSRNYACKARIPASLGAGVCQDADDQRRTLGEPSSALLLIM